MSILLYAESSEGKLKKTAFELASYAKGIALETGKKVTALTFNVSDATALSKYGVDKVLNLQSEKLNSFNARAYADALSQAAKQEGANIVLVSTSTNAKYLAPLLAVKLNAGFVSNVVALPLSQPPFSVKHAVFTNKAFGVSEIKTDIKLIGVSKNAYGLKENPATLSVETFNPTHEDTDFNQKLIEISQSTNKVTIADAEIVVSGGRGLKGPENWGMIEELASVLGAATACSKPVSDIGWRPHSEHVGQTGKPVAANLYIAIGISGAIQHLAGVNASKVKVVINNDPEAPFFKAADYGIVGDAFEVVPKLIEKLKEFKSANG